MADTGANGPRKAPSKKDAQIYRTNDKPASSFELLSPSRVFSSSSPNVHTEDEKVGENPFEIAPPNLISQVLSPEEEKSVLDVPEGLNEKSSTN